MMKVEMDLVSNDKILEVTDDLKMEKDSDFNGTLDLNLVASKDQEANGYSRQNSVQNDSRHEMEMDLNQDRQCSPLLPLDGSVPGGESPKIKPSLMFPSESPDTDCLHHVARKTEEPPLLIPSRSYLDDVEERNLGRGLKRLPSPPKDNHSSGEPEVVSCGDYYGKSSSSLQREACRDEKKTEDILLSAVANAKNEGLVESHDMHGAESPLDGQVNRYSDHFLGNPEVQKVNSASACESEIYHCTGKDESSLRAVMKKENCQYSDKLPTENGEIEAGNSDSHSPRRSCKRSVSPVKLLSGSPDISPYIQPYSGKHLSSPVKAVQESSHSPRLSRERHSAFHQQPTMDSTRVGSQEHLSPSAEGASTSPRRATKISQRKDHSPHNGLSESPRRQRSPIGHRKRTRSTSRSPVRRKASPRGRDYRDRSRSRSPHVRDRRRPSRRGYSPSRRSPRGHHSRHSPRRRPWSPPPNRSTGVGRPGKNLFVAGFSFVTTERDLERKFSRFGRVTGVRIVRDKRTGDSRGFGFLSLERDEDADAAIRALDQTQWNGRIVLVEKSKTSAR
eukprot:TRINITY_DN23486_c0_g1_i1.p1 TRINITY_DN23486_c0_g1~~TRINITY_DN23486_c0_g1_i1.p1  ORF type:complete len:561 (-),score=138.03 TRINITY_DN23486_c0_g1_i1:276-1958(-)